MTDYLQKKKSYSNSVSSHDSSALKGVLNRLSHLFHSPDDNNRRLSTSSNESDSSTASSNIASHSRHNRYNRRQRNTLVDDEEYSRRQSLAQERNIPRLVIPPFSPTYCKANEFPYSNFYVKLPNGKWMVRYRSGNRDILGTDEFEGYMI